MYLSSRPPLARIMAIDSSVRKDTWPNATTLGIELEVAARTIRRDITYMRDRLGAPLEFDPVQNGYHYTESGYRLPYFQLSEGELVALLLAGQLMRQYRGTPYEVDLHRAFAKLTELLPEAVSMRLDAVADCLAVLPTTRMDYDPATFAALASATVQHRRIEMVYWTAGRDAITTRRVDPYHLMLVEEGWYMVGHCHLRDQVLIFAAQRVRSIQETGESFDRPVDFRVEDYMEGSFRTVRGEVCHRVVLCFAPPFAGRIVERIWHPSQTCEPTADGGLILTIKVNDLREVTRWVLFWGSDCQVLEPTELRKAVTKELKSMLNAYKAV